MNATPTNGTPLVSAISPRNRHMVQEHRDE